MTPPANTIKTGPNFAAVNLGSFADLGQYTFELPEIPMKVTGKVFLKSLLGLSSAEISFNNLPPKSSMPFYHKHRLNEEIYIFVKGQGEFQVDDCVFPVTEGTAIRVNPDGERCMRNISQTEDLGWIVVQSRMNSQPDGTIEDGYGVQRRVSWVGKQAV